MHSRLTRGIRPRLEGKQRTPLSSRVATGISWNPQSGLKRVKPPVKFRERTRDCSPSHAGKEGPHLAMTGGSVLLPVVPSSSGLPSKSCPGIGISSSADREIGVFQHVAPPTRLRLEFPRDRPHPEARRKVREPFPDKAGESTLLSGSGGEKGLR